jgi:acyl dehydratase
MGGTDRWFDDFEVGETFVSAGVTVTEAQIIEFALVHDPQPFHTDVLAAKESVYGGLIASGLQTLGLGFRMFLMLGLFRACGMGSPGIDELRWPRPMRPGDTIRTEMKVMEKRPSRSGPDRGIVLCAYRVLNQAGEEVCTWKCMQLLAKRPGTYTLEV